MSNLYRGTVTPKDWAFVGGIGLLLVALILVFVFFVHAGLQQRASELSNEISQKTTDLLQAQEQEKNMPELEAEMEATQELVAAFEERLPNQRELNQFVTSFEAMARELDVRVDVTTLGRDESGNKITHPFSVTAYGGFHNITGFINELERYDRYLKITDIDMDEMDAGIIEAQFTLNAYQFVEGQQSGEAGTAT
jgi:Tfp pilus assembly protein PilO